MNDELTEHEQMMEAVLQLAGLVRAYYEALLEKGFTKEQAILLSAGYQKEIISCSKNK